MQLKKSLGQHILIDGQVLSDIVDAARLQPGGAVVEIGPGTGVLTQKLLAGGARVLAIEKDDRFAGSLADYATLHGGGSLAVLHADILETSPEKLIEAVPGGAERATVVANLPYNIATAVVMKLLGAPELFPEIVVLVQKEVAARIASPPGQSSRGSLSVWCQSRAECSLGFSVPPSAFNPPPAVMSAVLMIKPYTADPFGIDDRRIFDFLVEGAFEHRRKTCYNSLRISLEKGACKALLPPEIDTDTFLERLYSGNPEHLDRAQELELKDWVLLANKAAGIIGGLKNINN